MFENCALTMQLQNSLLVRADTPSTFSAKPISLKSPLLTANPQSYATQSISLVILCTLVCPSASGVIVVSTVIPG